MSDENLAMIVLNLEKSDSVIEELNYFLKSPTPDTVSPSYVSQLGTLIEALLNKHGAHKSNKEYAEWLRQCYKVGVEQLEKICSHNGHKDTRSAAFEALLKLMPVYNDALNDKPMFPNEEYAAVIRLLMVSECDISCLIPHLRNLMEYQDMRNNIWKAIDLATKMDRLPNANELRRILNIINIIEPSGEEFGPKLHYSRVKVGVLNSKETNKCVTRIWERLSRVKVENDLKVLLLLALLEKMMKFMDRPIFLIDHFMESLEQGGAIGILSLQGIFNLIQKYNMNYPAVYEKLYAMFQPELFRTLHKARFYHLADLFLSSAMLPEALVAGFIKRLARLSLVAPPPDIIILMSFITNLFIRHPNLIVMLSRPSCSDFEADPYIMQERVPSQSKALESCLWEIKLLEDHVLPSVANSARIVSQELSNVEKDLSSLLENKTEMIFRKEMSIKAAEPAITFDRPTQTFLKKLASQSALSTWE